jgi:hypothetical protein
MDSNEALIAFAQKAFVHAIICAIGMEIKPEEVCVKTDGKSYACLWKNDNEEHIEAKFFYEGPSVISPEHSATIVIRVIALFENGHMRLQFPLQNCYVRNLDSDSPQVIVAL